VETAHVCQHLPQAVARSLGDLDLVVEKESVHVKLTFLGYDLCYSIGYLQVVFLVSFGVDRIDE